MEVHEYAGDASQQESIDRSKVHVAAITTSALAVRDLTRACAGTGTLDVDSRNVPCTTNQVSVPPFFV